MRYRFSGTQIYETELSEQDLEDLGLEEGCAPVELLEALRGPKGQAVMDRNAGEGTWVSSGMFYFRGLINAAAD